LQARIPLPFLAVFETASIRADDDFESLARDRLRGRHRDDLAGGGVESGRAHLLRRPARRAASAEPAAPVAVDGEVPVDSGGFVRNLAGVIGRGGDRVHFSRRQRLVQGRLEIDHRVDERIVSTHHRGLLRRNDRAELPIEGEQSREEFVEGGTAQRATRTDRLPGRGALRRRIGQGTVDQLTKGRQHRLAVGVFHREGLRTVGGASGLQPHPRRFGEAVGREGGEIGVIVPERPRRRREDEPGSLLGPFQDRRDGLFVKTLLGDRDIDRLHRAARNLLRRDLLHAETSLLEDRGESPQLRMQGHLGFLRLATPADRIQDQFADRAVAEQPRVFEETVVREDDDPAFSAGRRGRSARGEDSTGGILQHRKSGIIRQVDETRRKAFRGDLAASARDEGERFIIGRDR
jgi:hypothetical protein